MKNETVYYSDYLQLDKIIHAQALQSEKNGNTAAHDEMLFIIIHQAYELWFKQILFEINAVLGTMNKPSVNDNSPEMQIVVHRLKRTITILKVLVQQIDIMETMTPMDFLDFRDMLRPASGFQSWQFKIIEAKLGLKYEKRQGQEYYISQLKDADIQIIKDAEKGASLLTLINEWLERMPFFDDPSIWEDYQGNSNQSFWQTYERIYNESLADAEKNNSAAFQQLFNENHPERNFSAKASRAALFIMLYRGFPMLELPYQLLECLLEIDNQLGSWRYRHINMVQRMIGSRIGTGGSSGAGYLKAAMDKHYIFRELSQLNSFLIDRRKLPVLPKKLSDKLGYAV
ncbi:MAG: tryptophan 2,3-dioxygenase family protein [Chitinophagaceae bacterium]